MWTKLAALIAGIVIVAVIFVMMIMNHYEKVDALKTKVNAAELEKTELANKLNKEKADLMERYVKKLDEQHDEYRQIIKSTTQDYETRIKNLESGYQKKLADQETEYQEKITALNSENERLNRLLDDPDKRIPILVAEKNNLVKQLLEHYREEMETYTGYSAEVKKEFNQARMDKELFINVVYCRELAYGFDRKTNDLKSFANEYRKFLEAQERAFSEIDLDPTNDKTKLEEAVLGGEQALAAMEKENSRMHERHFTVEARQDWQDTGVTLETGDIVYVIAEGEWTVRSKKYADCTADGDPELPAKYRREEFSQINTGALITRIKNGVEVPMNQAGMYGQRFSFSTEASGRLEIAINDARWDDNGGKLKVRLVVKKAKY